MAGSIKGIIVEIGGDTSGLQKALSKVNSVTSSLSKELRGVNSLLKLDPKNTELLGQKQEILNKQIEVTRNELTTLQQVKAEYDKKMAEGTKINEENFRYLQREIINTQNKLNTLKTENSNWNKAGKKLEEYGQKLEDLGSKADKVANKMTVGLTVPIVAGFTAMTKLAIENETAVQQVERIYGDAAESIKEFAESKALDYNMSAGDAYKYSQIYGNLIQSITDDQQKNAEQTQKLLQASSIIASATGRSMEDVMDRIRSGLLGNTEAIEDLGVNVNVALLETTDAFKQIAGDKSWDKLTFQEQQQVRLLGILEQTSKKFGDEVQDNTASSIQQLTAKTKNLANSLGEKLLPIANKMLDKANDLVDSFNNLSDEEKDNIVKIGLIVATAGPLLKVGSTAIITIGKVTKGFGTMSQAIGVATGKMTSSKDSVNNLAGVFKATFSPTGLAVIGITAAVGIIINEIKKAEEEVKAKFETMGESAADFYEGIQSAEGYLDSFNTTLFATSEEQQQLQTQMDEIQTGITQICKTASDERRGYTQEEITQLDEYFAKLRELKNREIEIEKLRADAITQQAITISQTNTASLGEYQAISEQWISTAQKQADSTISMIENATIEEIALLSQRYGDQATIQNEAYAKEYNNIMAQKQTKIDLTNQEVSEVTSAFSQGYSDRIMQEDGYLNKIKEYTDKQQTLLNGHNEQIRKIKDNELWYVTSNTQAISSENETFAFHKKELYKEMYKNMSEEQAKELGVWIAQLANTELYGGKISEENQVMVDTILASYDEMPEKTKKAMENAMSPMLTEMENKEPFLFSKATGIADGILSRLKKSFNIHSPSRETRDIFRNVMQGAELGLEDEQKNLNKKVDTIAGKMKSSFADINPKMGAIKQSVIDKTRTIFTTPTIVINAQDELTPNKINTIIDTVNRRLGSRY